MADEPIVVGARAVKMARRVGPTAWTVLTVLAVDAEPDGGRMIARASVRSLAAALGLNKDTVGRALARLRRAELVIRVTGRFEVGVYRLTVPADVIRFNRDLAVHASRWHPRQGASSGVQLTFLDGE
jgi:DNA-binding transcriptional ArsR family regulator